MIFAFYTEQGLFIQEALYLQSSSEPKDRDYVAVAVLELEANTPNEAYDKITKDTSSRNSSNNSKDKLFLKIKNNSKIQSFFKPLNPYSTDVDMFKVESSEDSKPLDNVWFY